jgi:hypothetical protein
MNKQCDLVDNCAYFRIYEEQRSIAIDVWKKLFCKDIEKSEQCERKKIRRETGEPPPENMSPTGELLELPEDY